MLRENFNYLIRELHRRKSKAYGDAWKKRGELISIVANIARKVDRLENYYNNISQSEDETLLDTAVDLYVYCLKYVTFLADIDNEVRIKYFKDLEIENAHKISDGVQGFECLLGIFSVDNDDRENNCLSQSIQDVLNSFGNLEDCFDGLSGKEPPKIRLIFVEELIQSTLSLIQTINNIYPNIYSLYISNEEKVFNE